VPASQSTAPGSTAASKIVLSTAQREADELKRSREEDDHIRERSEKRARGEEVDGDSDEKKDASEDDMDMDQSDDDEGESDSVLLWKEMYAWRVGALAGET
jgi:hypothetical protein